jgi:hypothetical protein
MPFYIRVARDKRDIVEVIDLDSDHLRTEFIPRDKGETHFEVQFKFWLR